MGRGQRGPLLLLNALWAVLSAIHIITINTQTSIRLAIHLVGAPNSKSGGHELESLCGRNTVH
jgi:hypothetical protein